MFLCGAALVLALGGQLALQMVPNGLAPGLALSASGVALFLWSVLGLPAWMAKLAGRVTWSPAAGLIVVATCFSILATVAEIGADKLFRGNYTSVLALWLAGAAAYAGALAVGHTWQRDWRAWWREYRVELIGLGLIIVLAAAFRFDRLGALPRVIDGDEGKLGQAALLTTGYPLANPFALFENFGAVYLQAIRASIRAWGHTPFALRLLPALGGTLAIPALYLLARQLFGLRAAFTAAFLLAVSHAHIHFSRIVSVGYIQGTFLIPLELYFLFSGLQNKSALRLALGGIVLGLHLSVYISAQIMLAYLAVYLLVLMLFSRRANRPTFKLAAAWGYGVALLALPVAAYAVRWPGEFMARLNADGAMQSGWLAMTAAQTGQSIPLILAGRVVHAFLTLNHYPALDFYGTLSPLLDVITGILFLFGLGYSLWRTRERNYLLLNGYFWAVTLAVGLFAVPPEADSYRMLIALPAAILLAALGWEQVVQALALTVGGRRTARVVVSALVFACVAGFNWQIYFSDFVGQCRYGGDLATRFSSYLGNYARTLDREATIYLLSDQEIRYGTHPSTDFLSNNKRIINRPEPATGLVLGTNSVVVAAPGRADELRAWARERTDGRLSSVYDCNRLILLSFRIP
jgi:hypothetical protein